VEQRLGARRAAGDVDVHRDETVDALEDVVALLERAAGDGAGAHRRCTYFGSGIWFQSRTTCGAIFLVTVPDTIMRSACRGEGRKISAPKRAMSKRRHGGGDHLDGAAGQAEAAAARSELLRPQL